MPEQQGLLENITCSLCTGFLVDAVSLTECLHFFCRSCLLKRLQKSNRCPTCHRDLGHDLSSAFAFDETLQDLVYKMSPQLYWSELKSRGEFLRKAAVTEEERELIVNKRLLQVSSRLCAPEERVSVVLEYVSAVEAIAEAVESKDDTLQGCSSKSKNKTKAASFKRYFRCPATAKIQVFRKILEHKLELGDSYSVYFLDPKLKDALSDDYELRDLAYIFAWNRKKPVQLFFTLAKYPVEEEKPPVLDIEEMPELRAESPGAVNISMEEPVIDPHLPQLGVQICLSALENGGAHPGPIIRSFAETEEPPKKKRKPASKKTPLSNSALSNASGSSASNSPFNAGSPATPLGAVAQKPECLPLTAVSPPVLSQPVTIVGYVNSPTTVIPTTSGMLAGQAETLSPVGATMSAPEPTATVTSDLSRPSSPVGATMSAPEPTATVTSDLSRPSSSMGVTLPTRSEGAPLTPLFTTKTPCDPHPLKLPLISATSQASSLPIVG